MIRLNMPVIVEGKYDKITLENIIDAPIIKTDGFRIFSQKDKCDYIRALAKKNGIVVLTDSDNAGQLIRSYLKKICGDSKIVNVYIPQIKGKEKRKTTASKEGFLGVEGMNEEVIKNAFSRSNVSFDYIKRDDIVTKQDFYLYGLSGRENSASIRKNLASFLELPKNISSSAMLDAINSLYGKTEFERRLLLWQQDTDKK